MSRNRTTTRAWSAGVGLAVALSVSGCSSDAPKTAAQYRREANAVCRAARRAVAELPEVNGADPVALVESGRRALVDQRDAARSLHALRPPASLSRAARAWLELVGRGLNAIGDSLRAQAKSDLPAAERANASASKLVLEADAAARALGVSDCATPPT
ncbi:MAG: hypothetical protein ABIP21_03300 [Acidimicrobiia bacterium]